MATKPDLKAQKERKQKIVLAVGGVLLVGVLALQLPKLLKHSGGASATPATVTTPGATTPGATTPGGTTTATTPGAVTPSSSPSIPVSVPASANSAQLAGVALAPTQTPTAAQGQLWSFSRFKSKDPFVQQVSSTATAGGSPAPSGTPSAPGATPSVPSTPVIAAAPPTYATLLVNGRPQQLALKQLFPKADPIFVLVKLDGKTARIGVAGGSFTGGKTMLLLLGKRVTLMNTTTGQRYVVKLVYLGSQPETIAGFKGGVATGQPAPAATAPAQTSTAP